MLRSNPKSNLDPTTTNQHNQTTTTPPTKPKIHPTNQSPNPLISQQTPANKVTKPITTIVDKKKKRGRGISQSLTNRVEAEIELHFGRDEGRDRDKGQD